MKRKHWKKIRIVLNQKIDEYNENEYSSYNIKTRFEIPLIHFYNHPLYFNCYAFYPTKSLT